MIFTILEFYSELVSKDRISKPLYIKLQISNFILSFTGIRCMHHW
jgi:hypothetical protein